MQMKKYIRPCLLLSVHIFSLHSLDSVVHIPSKVPPYLPPKLEFSGFILKTEKRMNA